MKLSIDHVRIPVGYWLTDAPAGGGTMRTLGFNHEGFVTGGVVFLEGMLAKLKQRSMHALIDLHAMPGGASKCQSYAGMAVQQPYFWVGETGSASLQACGDAGPYTTSRPGGVSWISIGQESAQAIARWIVSLEAQPSLAGVVSGFEVVNEPGLGFNGMIQPIRAYHDAVVPAVQKIFREAGIVVNTTVNFIAPNDAGMGSWLKSRIDANAFDGSSLVVDYHAYLNWDGPLSFSQAAAKVCATTGASLLPQLTEPGWAQYTEAGLSVIIGEWADAIDINAPPTNDIDNQTIAADLATLFADQVSMFDSTPQTVGQYYWALRMGSGWDPRPNISGVDPQTHQRNGTAWDTSLKSFGDRVWNLGELARVGIVKSVGALSVMGVCKCDGCSQDAAR